MLLQPSQRLNSWPGRRLPAHKNITLRIDIPGGPPKLDTRDDEPNQPQDEEDEGAEDHDPGEQRTLRDQPEDEAEEKDCEGRDGDPVGEVPAGRKCQWDKFGRFWVWAGG
jgi:hypothetical protein